MLRLKLIDVSKMGPKYFTVSDNFLSAHQATGLLKLSQWFNSLEKHLVTIQWFVVFTKLFVFDW